MQGTLEDDKVKGVDREFPLYFSVIDENHSWYLNENFKYCSTADCGGEDENFEFVESNQMNAINGRIYGNLEVYTATSDKNMPAKQACGYC